MICPCRRNIKRKEVKNKKTSTFFFQSILFTVHCRISKCRIWGWNATDLELNFFQVQHSAPQIYKKMKYTVCTGTQYFYCKNGPFLPTSAPEHCLLTHLPERFLYFYEYLTWLSKNTWNVYQYRVAPKKKKSWYWYYWYLPLVETNNINIDPWFFSCGTIPHVSIKKMIAYLDHRHCIEKKIVRSF